MEERDQILPLIDAGIFPENEGRVFVSDSAGSPSDDTSITVLSPEEYEDDSVEQVHLESDFIGFYSTTPGK